MKALIRCANVAGCSVVRGGVAHHLDRGGKINEEPAGRSDVQSKARIVCAERSSAFHHQLVPCRVASAGQRTSSGASVWYHSIPFFRTSLPIKTEHLSPASSSQPSLMSEMTATWPFSTFAMTGPRRSATKLYVRVLQPWPPGANGEALSGAPALDLRHGAASAISGPSGVKRASVHKYLYLP